MVAEALTGFISEGRALFITRPILSWPKAVCLATPSLQWAV